MAVSKLAKNSALDDGGFVDGFLGVPNGSEDDVPPPPPPPPEDTVALDAAAVAAVDRSASRWGPVEPVGLRSSKKNGYSPSVLPTGTFYRKKSKQMCRILKVLSLFYSYSTVVNWQVCS